MCCRVECVLYWVYTSILYFYTVLHTLARICGGNDFFVLIVGSEITGMSTSRGCEGVKCMRTTYGPHSRRCTVSTPHVLATCERPCALLQQMSGSFWRCQPRLQISSSMHTVGRGVWMVYHTSRDCVWLLCYIIHTCMVANSLSLPSVLPRNCVRTCEKRDCANVRQHVELNVTNLAVSDTMNNHWYLP